jgi:hypothetical protein
MAVRSVADLSANLNSIHFDSRFATPAVVKRAVDGTTMKNPPAPAWYDPTNAEITVHVDAAEVDLRKIDRDALARGGANNWSTVNRDTAKLIGLVAHENGHVHISNNMADAMDVAKARKVHGSVISTLVLLEELRVEAFAIRRAPTMRAPLRASFAMVLDHIAAQPPTTDPEAARAWALVHGRTLGGIATPTETQSFDTAARTILTDDVVDQLSELLQEAIVANLPADRDRVIEIAQEWVDLVGKGESGSGEGGDGYGSCSGCDDPTGEGRGKGKGSGDDEVEAEAGGGGSGDDGDAGDPTDGEADSEKRDGASDYGREGSSSSNNDLADDETELLDAVVNELRKIMDDEWRKPERAHDLANPTEMAREVFGKPTTIRKKETPTPTDRQNVVKVAQFLENVSLSTISKTAKAMATPPGRLRTREGVRRSAERAQGMMVTAKPWKGSVRRHSQAKPLVIGIATDVSGSMRWAERGVAEFAYAYANAGHRIGARTAAVTFGDDVQLVSRPGEIMEHLLVKAANGGSEEFDHAIAALDGVLHLTDPSGSARILIVVSDGAFVKDKETGRAVEWLRRLDKAGTHVIWINQTMPHDRYWLGKIAKEIPNMTVMESGVDYAYRETSHRVYNSLDAAVRKSIIQHIS